MGSKAATLTPTDKARLFYQALRLEGVLTGTRIPRQLFDEMVMVVYEVANRTSIVDKARMGVALRLWSIQEAHGKGGRGWVTLLQTEADRQALAEPEAIAA